MVCSGENVRVCEGTFARERSRGNVREGTFAWERSRGNVREGTFARGDLQGHRTNPCTYTSFATVWCST